MPISLTLTPFDHFQNMSSGGIGPDLILTLCPKQNTNCLHSSNTEQNRAEDRFNKGEGQNVPCNTCPKSILTREKGKTCHVILVKREHFKKEEDKNSPCDTCQKKAFKKGEGKNF